MQKIFFFTILSFIAIAAPFEAQGLTTQELLQQIAQLQTQIIQLQSQLATLKQTSQSSITPGVVFQKPLQITDKNEEVRQLQQILKTEGLFCKSCVVTGYFGYWTKAGLMNFQKKYGLLITGIVDSPTRAKLNQLTQPLPSSSSPVAQSPNQTLPPLPPPPPPPLPSQTASSITVLVLSPNGGEQLKSGGLHNITWSTNASAVNIELWKGNTFIQHLAIGVEGGKSLFPWAIPLNLSLGNDYKIYVSVMNAQRTSVQFFDSSDAPFSIILSSTPPPPPPPTDNTLPAAFFGINGGATATSSSNVTLSLSCTDASGIKDVRYSNDGVFDTEPFEPFTAQKSWTLTSGDGTRTVFYQCRDNSANQNTSVVAQSILLNVPLSPPPPPIAALPPPAADITRPSPSLSINGGQTTTSSPNVTLSLSCTDASGIKDVRYSNDGVFDTEPFEPYAVTKSWTLTSGDGTRTVFYQCRDNSINQNANVTAQSIRLDTTPPIRSNLQPSGTLSVGTTQTTLSLTTNENATCKYTTTAGMAYDSMTNIFSTTGALLHSISITGLTNGTNRTYFIRCNDIPGNVNSDDFNITFSVAIPTPTTTPTSIPILVLKYFPLQTGTQNLDTTVTGMQDSLASIRSKVDNLTQQGIDKMEIGSTYHGYKDVSAAKSLDYFVLDTKEFLSAIPVSNNQIPWNPSAFRPDYMKMLNDVNICDYVNNRGVKHVWVWGYHFGNIEPAEANMAMGTASQAFWNHGAYGDVSNSEQINDMPTCSKTYTLYNYNYGRGLGELLEDHGHQLESIYSFVDNNLWSKFRNPYGEPSPVVNSCGWTHSGPNSKAEYQPGWASEATFKSNCEDWHPDGSGVVKDVSCHTWYGATCMDNGGVEFKVWWMQNIPGKNNNLIDGTKKLRNWWDFYGDFDSAVQQGKNLSS